MYEDLRYNKTNSNGFSLVELANRIEYMRECLP